MRQVVYKLLELYCGHIYRKSAAQCIALCCTMQLIEKFSPKCSFIKRKVYLHIVDKKMGRITWVCTTCSQNFTRKFSANRHNKNSHSGRAVIVRLLDYLVGRAKGDFQPANPLSFRKGRNTKSPFHSNYKNNLGFSGHQDNMGDETFPEYELHSKNSFRTRTSDLVRYRNPHTTEIMADQITAWIICEKGYKN
jgi:hypothetical protein